MLKFITLLCLGSFLIVTAQKEALSAPSGPGNDTELCKQFFQDLTHPKHTKGNFTVEINNFDIYSGHNINDLGFYDQCRNISTQKYSVLSADGFSMGLCGPSFCSIPEMQNNIDTIMKRLGNLTRKDLTPYQPKIVDPDITGLEKGISYFFAVLLFVILITLIVAGTISANYMKPKQKPQAPQEDNTTALREALMLNKDSTNDNVITGRTQSYLTKKVEEVKPVAPAVPAKPIRPSFYSQIIECFDLSKNFSSLFKNEIVPGHDQNLNIFNGIRTFAFGWVVYGHTFMLCEAAKNVVYVEMFVKSTWALLVVGAFFAVDTFFYLSGFLTGFLMVSKLKKLRLGAKSYVMILFHRWIRLWPTYFVAILFFWKISVHFGSGPLWQNYVATAQLCDSSWWKNLLLLDNVLVKKFSTECFGWGWYLACDFQVFMIAPFICWIYIKDREKSQKVVWLLMTISIVASYIYSGDSNYTYMLQDMTASTADWMSLYYINPVVRMSPYLIGLWLGFVFKEYKEGADNFFARVQKSKKLSMISALSGFGLLLFILFYPRVLQIGYTWTKGFGMTWSTFNRPMWAVGLFLLTAPCLVGNLKRLSAFLSNFYFTIVARVSYTAYLVHLMIILMVYNNSTQSPGVQQIYQAGMAFSFFLISCVGAIILHLVIEKPMANLDSKLLAGKRRPREVVQKDSSDKKKSQMQTQNAEPLDP